MELTFSLEESIILDILHLPYGGIVKLRDFLNPPIPEKFEYCKGFAQKRRWAADRALTCLVMARDKLELASRLPEDQVWRDLKFADEQVDQARRHLNCYPVTLTASRILLRWMPSTQLEEQAEDYFVRQIALLDRAIRRLRINRFSLMECIWSLCFGDPEPFSS